MEFSAKQISQFIQGRVEGDENVTINTFTKIEEGKKGAISFLANPKYTHYLYETESSIVLVDEDIQLEKKAKPTLIRVKNARDCVAKLSCLRLTQGYDRQRCLYRSLCLYW